MKTTNLTIQEAIKSGLPFKRSIHVDFLEFTFNGEETLIGLSKADILATDWQIKVPEVTITREKLAEAWDRGEVGFPSSRSDTFKILCKALGL